MNNRIGSAIPEPVAYYPLGTIVTLKKTSQKLLIVGRYCKDSETDRRFDYCGVPWPDGLTQPGDALFFDDSSIQLIHFLGLQNAEEYIFREKLESKVSQQQQPAA